MRGWASVVAKNPVASGHMPFAANVLRVLIASPSDTAELRDVVERALHEWNGDRSIQSAVMLLPRRWETNAVPELSGEDGQSVINRQLVADADVVIGVFHAKLGQKTPRYASGTAEELGEARNAGKRVHVYFSSMPVDRQQIDLEALATLDAFKKEIEELGLYGSFDTPGSLKEQVRRAIEADLTALNLGKPSVQGSRARDGASLRATYEYAREPNNMGRLVTRRQRLVVTNTGGAEAADITFELVPIAGDDRQAPHLLGEGAPFTLPADGGRVAIPISTSAGTATTTTINFTWIEGDKEHTSSQTISFT